MKVFTLSLLILCTLLRPFSCLAETVYLSAAASMTDALQEIVEEFAADHPGITVQLNFASSGSLAKQIEQGAPVALYISANPKWMAYLLEQGLIEPDTSRILVTNQLVFIGAESGSTLSLETLSGLSRIALGAPQTVPAGQYAAQAMEHAGIYQQLASARKLILARDVRQALLYADRGEVDGAFVYRTDALLARSAVILFTVPADLHDPIAYPLGLTKAGATSEAARTLYGYLLADQAAAIFARYGFTPAP